MCCWFVVTLAMRIPFLVGLLFVAGCSTNKSAEIARNPGDSLRSEEGIVEVPLLSGTSEIVQVDSGTYIGPMDTFVSTQEYYTPLYYLKDEIDEQSRQNLLDALDSVVYEGTDEKRSRLPITIAGKHFNLVGLDTISIFNDKGIKLYRARLIRVEYYDTSIEGGYIAVFKPIGKVKFSDEVGYCVSSGKHSLAQQHSTWQDLDDQSLTANLLQTFSVDSQNVWRVTHTQMVEDKSTYSTVALYGDGSFLAKTKDGKSTILKRLSDNTSFIELYPVHFRCEGHPVFLAQMGINETDAIWVSLLVYSDGEYKVMARNRTD